METVFGGKKKSAKISYFDTPRKKKVKRLTKEKIKEEAGSVWATKAVPSTVALRPTAMMVQPGAGAGGSAEGLGVEGEGGAGGTEILGAESR